MEDVLLAFDDQGMSGVVSALEADYVLGSGGKQVNDFSFAFVAPLSSYYDHIGHFILLSLSRTDLTI